MSKTTNQQVSKAARRYLEAKDYTVLDEFERDGMPYIAADDDGEVVIARVSCGLDRIPEPWRDREAFEKAAAFYLKRCEDADVPVRGDSVDIMVLSGSRGFLRHTVNCMGSFVGAA